MQDRRLFTHYSRAVGIPFFDGLLSAAGESSNKYVALFSCNSADYAVSLVQGPKIFSVESGADKSSPYGLTLGAQKLIMLLIRGSSITNAANSSGKLMNYQGAPEDKNDKIVVK